MENSNVMSDRFAIVNNSSSVTHIEIISSDKPCTTSNSPVVLNSSRMKHLEPTLASVYRHMLNDSDKDCRICDLCGMEALSITQLKWHVKEVHSMENVSFKQCLMCRKKYVFAQHLKKHLQIVHGIFSPEVVCKVCFIDCNTQLERKAHERKHDKTYLCRFCPSKSPSEYFSRIHYFKHLKKMKPYECKMCGKRFVNSLSLKLHSKRHMNINCSECSIHFQNDIQFLHHLKSNHCQIKETFLGQTYEEDNMENNLEEMLNIYMKKSVILRETEKYKGIDLCILNCVSDIVESVSAVTNCNILLDEEISKVCELSCYLCSRGVMTALELVKHHETSHSRNRTCSFCGKRSKSVSMTYRHMGSHVRAYSKNIENKSDQKCQSCSTKNVKQMKKSKGKPNSQSHSCVKCQKKYHQTSLHSKQKNNKENCLGQFVCTFNDSVVEGRKEECYQPPHEPSWDRSQKESELKNFICDVCSKVFLLLKSLIKHKQLEHHDASKSSLIVSSMNCHLKWRQDTSNNTKKKFRCGYCPVGCRTLSGLRVHLRAHSGEHPYCCEHCKTKFTRQSALKKHLKNVHCQPESVSYSCTKCPLFFTDKGNLLRHHLSVHLDIRRFICGLCGLKYGQNQDLRRHLRQKHQIEGISYSSMNKKAYSELYVFPSIINLSESDPLFIKINEVIKEEKKKCESVDEIKRTIQKVSSRSENEVVTPASNKVNKASQTVADVTQCEVNTHAHQTRISRETLLGTSSSVHIKEKQTLNKDILYLREFYMKDSAANHNVAQVLTNSVCNQQYSSNIRSKNHTVDVKCIQSPAVNNIMISCASSQEQKSDKCNERTNITLSTVQQLLNEQSTHPSAIPDEIMELRPVSLLDSSSVMSLVTVQQFPPNCTCYVSTPSILQTSFSIINIEQSPQTTLNNNRCPAEFISNNQPIYGVESFTPVTKDPCCIVLQNNGETHERINSSLSVTDNHYNAQRTELQVFGKETTEKSQSKEQFTDSAAVGKSVKSQNEKLYRCSQCEKQFREKSNFTVHMRHHTGEKPYSCTKCGKTMRYHKELVEHKWIHDGILPYICEQCGKCFSRQRVFVRHKQTHSSVKKYKCAVCEKTFNRLDQLKGVHMRTHQNDIRNLYTCDLCQKNFKMKSKLEKHLMLHSGNKNFKCPKCSKKFALNIYLKSHLRTHEKQTKYVACARCPRKFTSSLTLKVHIEKFHERLCKVSTVSSNAKFRKSKENISSFSKKTVSLFPSKDVEHLDNSDSEHCDNVMYLEMVPDTYNRQLHKEI